MTSKSTAATLLSAADYIAEVGWCRGDWYRKDGKACLAGAVGVVTGALVPLTEGWKEKEIARLRKAVPALSEKEAARSVPLYRWSADKRKLLRYADACEILSVTINSEFAASLQYRLECAHRWADSEAWSPARRAEYVEGIRRTAVQEDVVEYNDAVRSENLPDGTAKFRKTTKAAALKLLRKAAEAAAAA